MQLLYDVKPDLIIETGTNAGGSALYMSVIMAAINPTCKILTVDTHVCPVAIPVLVHPPTPPPILTQIHVMYGIYNAHSLYPGGRSYSGGSPL